MIKRIFYIFLLLTGLLIYIPASAQDFSYIYIQGDKKTPIYVKLEGQMMPRYGKNYSIISRLAPGPVAVEVLFQQNAYPPQSFIINVPESGHRGFLLVQKDDAFSLYDLQRQYYIPAGNKAEDDVFKTLLPEETHVPVKQQEPPKNMVTTPPVKPKQRVVKKPSAKPIVKEEIAKNSGPVGPQFIDDIELSNNKTIVPQNIGIEEEQADSFKNPVAIINSDCPKAISNKKFETINNKVRERSGTEKLKYLMSELNNCYTTNQVETLTRTLKTDAEKFTYLKNVYSRITDQAVFPKLERLLISDEWKSYFRELISKPE